MRLGSLTPTRDWSYVADTVDGFLAAGDAPDAIGRTINIGSGREITIRAAAEMIAARIGRTARIEEDGQRVRPAGSEVDRLLADTSLAHSLLGWAPRVSFEHGLELTIEWMQANLEKYRPGVYVTLSRGAPALDGLMPLCAPEIGGNEWRYVKECLDTGWVSSVGPVRRPLRARDRGLPRRRARGGDRQRHRGAARRAARRRRQAGRRGARLDAHLHRAGQRDPLRRRVAGVHRRRAGVLADGPAAGGGVPRPRLPSADGGLRNRATGRRVSAILPVHILGHPVDLDPILELARRHGLRVIEDATESLGARYRGAAVGCLGDVACFSFNGNKIITTGGGGMLVTGDKGLADRARYLTTQAKDDPLEYIHDEIGYNYRLTNVQAAIGCAQLERLDEYVGRKRRIAAAYAAAFAGVPGLTVMREAPWAASNFWMFTVLVDSARAGVDSRAVMRRLSESGIQARPLWQPIHRSPAYADLPHVACPVADRLHAEAISLPCSVGLSGPDQARVIRTLLNAIDTRPGH